MKATRRCHYCNTEQPIETFVSLRRCYNCAIAKNCKVCPQCNCSYSPTSRRQIFCSIACRAKDHTRIFTCHGCGKIFESDRERKYCTFECQIINRPPRPQKIKLPYFCEWCGKKRLAYPSRKRRFCSNECASASLAIERLGVNNPMFTGGAPRKRGRNWKTQSHLALKRDNKTCQICGRKPKRGQKRIVDVHHIVKYRLFNGDWLKANDLSNLITLCRRCHFMVEFHGLPCPQPLF